MATFITVTEGDTQLLRRNREQVQGNRLRKVEGDEQTRAARDIRAIKAQQPPELIPARRPVRLRRDEPAASSIRRIRYLLRLRDAFADAGSYGHAVTTAYDVGLSGDFVAEGANSYLFGPDGGQILVDQNIAPAIGTGNFTISMWVRETENQDWPTIISAPGTVPTLDIYKGSLNFYESGTVDDVIPLHPGGGQTPGKLLVHQQVMSFGVYHHVAAMRLDGVVRIYVNGVPSLESYAYTGNIDAGSWMIGDWSQNPQSYYVFSGYLDDVIVANTLLYNWNGFVPVILP